MYLTKEQSYNYLLDETEYKYLSLIDKNMYPIRFGYSSNVNIKDIINYYTDNFTEKEIKIITDYNNKANKLLENYFPKIDIYYIKLKSGFDWNYPFTKNKSIIFTQGFLNTLEYNSNEILELFIHEKIHILQRYYPTYFTKLYNTKYNFINYNTSNIKAVFENYILNPDGINLNWVYPLNYGEYFVLPYCSYNNGKLETKVIIFDKNNKVIFNGLPDNAILFSDMKTFINKFNKVSYYHINEISAYDLAHYIVYKKYKIIAL